jgi:hypothetical protein
VPSYRIDRDQVELVTLEALVEGHGIDSASLDAVAERRASAGCRRLWLVTSNDNLGTVRSDQRRVFRIVALHRGAIDDARRLKPQYPRWRISYPVHDEIELEPLFDERSRNAPTRCQEASGIGPPCQTTDRR